MPHIIVEYSANLNGQVDVQGLVATLHDTLAKAGIDKTRIKTRAVALSDYRVGDLADGAMIHATLLLLKGRDIPTRKSYGQSLYDVLKPAAPAGCAVTLEVREMEPETYFL